MSGNPGTDPQHPLTAGLHQRLERSQIIHRAIPFGDSPFNPSFESEDPDEVLSVTCGSGRAKIARQAGRATRYSWQGGTAAAYRYTAVGGSLSTGTGSASGF